MISKFDIIRVYSENEERDDADKLPYKLSDDHETVLDRKTGEPICSIDTYLKVLREKLHCDFECIYSDHASLTVILRCKQCGTVIFTGDDERYEPSLTCPTCSDYKPSASYWTAEEIECDKEKQNTIDMYTKMDAMQQAAEKRRNERNGLYDWQLWLKTIYTKKYYIRLELRKMSLYGEKLRGLHLTINVGTRDIDDYDKFISKHVWVPLSPYAFYIKWIFPYTTKCTDSNMRKYTFWQKKSDVEGE